MRIVTLRGRLLGRDLTSGIALTAAVLGATAVVAYLLVFRLFAASTASLVEATATLSFVTIAATRQLAASASERRARLSEMARMGRFSAQMAHDLQNPLAALKGAAQFLQEEQKQGRSLADQAEFFEVCAADRAGAKSGVQVGVSREQSTTGPNAATPARAEVCSEDEAREVRGLGGVVFPSPARRREGRGRVCLAGSGFLVLASDECGGCALLCTST